MAQLRNDTYHATDVNTEGRGEGYTGEHTGEGGKGTSSGEDKT